MGTLPKIVEQIDGNELSAVDLRAAAGASSSWVAYRIELDNGNRGDLLWFSDIRRGGVCLGSNSVWSDANSPEDLLHRVVVSGEIVE